MIHSDRRRDPACYPYRSGPWTVTSLLEAMWQLGDGHHAMDLYTVMGDVLLIPLSWDVGTCPIQYGEVFA